ncbi:MAG: hypothetical protein OEY93_01290, partial [Anaerolineae bacterium]|nr:hypothetical protein [Anaerolineae bacterium]
MYTIYSHLVFLRELGYDMLLDEATQFLSFLGMGIALWLGIYVVTNSPKNIMSWLTGLTMWSIAGLYLNILLALNPPQLPDNLPEWVRLFMPFWRASETNINPNNWLQGWSIAPAIMFWHHATVLFRPGKMNKWRIFRIVAGYFVGIAAIIAQYNSALLVSSQTGDPLYLTAIKPGPFYAVFLILLLLFTGLCIYNLVRSAKAAQTEFHRRQLRVLIVSTVVAGLGGPVSLVSTGFGVRIPILVISVILSISMLQIGYSVAAYSAMGSGRTIRRDFIYNFLSVFLVAVVYASITRLLDILFDLPSIMYVFVVSLAILSHSLTDAARRYLDTLFFKREAHQVRRTLRELTRIAGEPETDEALEVALVSICALVQATFGAILEFDNGAVKVVDQHKISFDPMINNFAADHFLADDLMYVEQNQFPAPLAELALSVPLYRETDQIGVLLLGRPVNSTQFSEQDIDRLLYPVDRLADLMWGFQKESKYLAEMLDLTDRKTSPRLPAIEKIDAKQVEDGLRKLYDYAYLGNHPLSQLTFINKKIRGTHVTHVDQGKALKDVLVMLIEKLKPESNIPSDPPPREWHA